MWVDSHMINVGALEVVKRRLLKREYSIFGAFNPRRRERACDNKFLSRIQVGPPVEAEGVRSAIKIAQKIWLIEISEHHSSDEAYRLMSFIEFLQAPHNVVRCERLDDVGKAVACPVVSPRIFPPRERMQGSQRPAFLNFSCQFCRTEDGCPIRDIGISTMLRGAMGRSSYTPAVEKLRISPVESPIVVRSAESEAVEIRPLNEEGSFLIEEGFELG